MAGKKYDYFDEQNDQAKQDLNQFREQMEQMAKDQAKDALKRYREMSQKSADMAGDSAVSGGSGAATGASAGSTGMTAATGGSEGSGAAVGSGGMTAAAETGTGSGAAVGTSSMTAGVTSAGSGATVGGSAAGMTAVGGGGTAVGGAGAGAGAGGIAVGWKVILIILIVLLVIVILYFLISAVLKLDKQLRDVDPNTVDLDYIPDDKKVYNNAEYVLGLLEGGYITLETSEVGAFDNDYAKPILRAVADEAEARGENISVSYEGKAWVLVEDANGKTIDDLIKEIEKGGGDAPDYYVDKNGATFTNKYGKWQESSMKNAKLYTKLSRKDIESTSFQSDYFADPYELRWQPVYVLCAMKVAGEAGNWGLTEKDANGNQVQLTYEKMNTDGADDYFLKDTDIQECIDCFQPKFRYIWNPLEKGMDGKEFSYDDDEMKVYLVKDNRETNTVLGQREYVYHIPVVAASYVDLGYRQIWYNLEVENGEKIIKYRTVNETPEEWVQKLNVAAGGYFDQDRFLYLLGQLPDTDDLVEEYRKIFEATDTTYDDYTVSGCVGGHVRDAYVNGNGSVMWTAYGDIDPTTEIAVYMNYNIDKKNWEPFKSMPDEISTVQFVIGGMTYARPYDIQDEGERLTKDQITQLLGNFGGHLDGCENAFLKIQNEQNLSIPFCMGILKAEGSYHTKLGREYYNFGSEVGTTAMVNDGTALIWGHRDDGSPIIMKNFKEIYKNTNYASLGFSSLKEYCLYLHMKKLIYDTYYLSWNRRSAYAYCFNTNHGLQMDGELVNATDYSMCYCPVYDDLAWIADGVTEDGYFRVRNGWVGNVNKYRESFERQVGYDIYAD